MECAAKRIGISLTRNNSVQITLECKTAYEAAILYDDITSECREGRIYLKFEVSKITIDR